jgi:hypothetical protein
MAVMDALGDPFVAWLEEHLPDLLDGLEAHRDFFFIGAQNYGEIWGIGWSRCWEFAEYQAVPDADREAWRQHWLETYAEQDDLLVWSYPDDPQELEAEILAFLERHDLVLTCATDLKLPPEREKHLFWQMWFDWHFDCADEEEQVRRHTTDPRDYAAWERDYEAAHPETDWAAIRRWHDENDPRPLDAAHEGF